MRDRARAERRRIDLRFDPSSPAVGWSATFTCRSDGKQVDMLISPPDGTKLRQMLSPQRVLHSCPPMASTHT